MPTIHQTATIPARPAQIYRAWLSSRDHSAFTGDTAVIDPVVGGQFTVFGGYAEGETVTLVPNKKIVQTWHAADWPANAQSRITVILQPVGQSTHLTFHQTGVPAKFLNSIEQGWTDYYWTPLKTFFRKEKSFR